MTKALHRLHLKTYEVFPNFYFLGVLKYQNSSQEQLNHYQTKKKVARWYGRKTGDRVTPIAEFCMDT
jgi:hypothetical protein